MGQFNCSVASGREGYCEVPGAIRNIKSVFILFLSEYLVIAHLIYFSGTSFFRNLGCNGKTIVLCF